MLINQRDVIHYEFPFPNGKSEQHLVIVLSIQPVSKIEGTFIGVPICPSDLHNNNGYSFHLFNTSFVNQLPYEESHAIMHLITVLRTDQIKSKKINEMKQEDFTEMYNQIQELIFGVSAVPV